MLRVVILLLSCEASTGEAEDPWEYSESVSSGLALDFIFCGTPDGENGTPDGESGTPDGESGTPDGKVVPLMVNSSFKTNHVRRVPVFSDQIDGCACGILFCHSGARSCTLLDCILLVGCDYSCDSWALIFEILMLRRLCCFKNSLSSQQFKYLY